MYQKESEHQFGDESSFLALRDNTTRSFRQDQRDGELQIIKNMVKLRSNMKYNEHLRSVYEKAKEIFDGMVHEHREQIRSLDEIHRHLYEVIRDEIKQGVRNNKVSEMKKDMDRIARLLKRMRQNLEYLMNVDSVVGITIDKIDEIRTIDEVIEDQGNNENESDSDSDEPEVIEYIDDEDSDDEDSDDEDSGDEDSDDEDSDDEDSGDEDSDDEDSDDEDSDDEDSDDEDSEDNI